MITRDAAIAAAALVQAEMYRLAERLPARELAERAHRPGGPSVNELEAEIRARRHERPAARAS